MTEEYSRACLRVAVAQICQHLGWNSIHTTPMELLTDVLERYLFQLGKVTHRYSEQFGRTDARLEDVLMAFTHMGVQVNELEDYVKHVEPLPFAKEIVSYPTPQENDLKFPNPDSKEVQQRKVFEYVPEHLPYMHPERNEEPEDTNQSARPASPERLQVEPQLVEMSPVAGEKRPVSSPGDSSLQPFKRQRLTTSQPLPEEASQSQYEMTSVVMTHSGILSPIREGKVPDSKAPPAGFKQIVIVRQKSAAGQAAATGIPLPTDASIIKLDFNKDPSKGGKIVQIQGSERDSGAVDFDKNDPEYKPKAKKKFKDLKKEKLPQKPFKIKRGPGRPRSPGRAAAVVHNRGAIGFSRIPAVSHMTSAAMIDQESPIDLSLKPTPPPLNINVIKADDPTKEQELKILDYRPKTSVISKQQERDYEDTIDSVIGNKTQESGKSFHKEASIAKEKKSKQMDEWRVSHISESCDDDDDNKDRDYSRPESESPYPPPSTTIAPHLKFLYSPPTATVPVSPRPRGRPRGSGSGFYRSYAGRSPMGGRRGRPPLHRGSPGRPPLNRSPGRPPLNRSPGRPPLNRSPGRPPSGRSPGRPKGSGLSPRPRGRPRGSKSPRSRGASPRGGSPRVMAHLKFDENNDSNESKSTHIFKLDNDDSEATLFEFPSRSPAPSSPKKECSPAPIRRTPSAEDRSSSIPSPAPTEPAGSTGSRDLSPPLSPSSDHSSPLRKEPTPEKETRFSPVTERIPENKLTATKMREADLKKPWDTNKDIKLEIEREMAQKDHAERERQERERSWDREYKDRDRDYKERSRERERSRDREHSRDRERKEHSRDREHKDHSRDRDREHKEHSRDRDREHKEHSRDREHKEHSRDREHKEHSRDREHKEHRRDREHKEHSSDREHKEHSRDRDREHKEHSRDRDSRDREHKEHSKDRDRSKEHRKDKKKKKKKNKDREKEREDDKERKEKHKEKKEREREKESREESPSVLPLQKLKIKFGGGSASSPGSFRIATAKPSTTKHEPSPKPEHISPVHRPEIPKLKFKILPPKSDASNESDKKSWVSVKKENSVPSRQEPMMSSPARVSPSPGSRTVSPKPKSGIDSDSDRMSDDGLMSDKPDKSGEEEVTVTVVKGKVIVKKASKRGKRKGSGKKGRPKGDGFKKEPSSLRFGELSELPISAVKRELEKEASPISPPFSPQNVPSPITIPALKAAPPPPSPPAPSKKISPPKPKPILKEQKPISPLVKDITKSKPTPVPVLKPTKLTKSPRRISPKKSPKISPTSKKKGSLSPVKTSPTKSFPFMEFTSPRTPSPHRSSSPSASAPSSPMYSPASSPARDSPLHFQIPPTPAFPTRTNSPPASPLSRQISTDDETEVPSVSDEKARMPPPDLPPMPPTSAQRRAQRTVVTETVGSFVNESGEKIWICPACTMQDDGSPMIGCDMCDDWYHWICVGIKTEPNEDEQWYCPKCQRPNKSKSKRGRKKRKS